MPAPALLASLACAALAVQPGAAPAAASAPATAPASAPGTGPTAATAPSAPFAAPGEAPTQAGLDDLRRAYHDSCEVRLYGEYDDVCSDLSDQIRRYRTALARAARRPSRP